MKLPLRRLPSHLQGQLAGFYLVGGNEPLLVGEALGQIREAARVRGFEDRELHTAGAQFPWAELEAGSSNLSLFGARRILEVRLPSPSPGTQGARVLRSLAERQAPDCLVIVGVTGRLDARTAWVKAVAEHGVLVEVWPVDRQELPRWIGERASALGLRLTTGAAALLADRVEGNLLAADQELRKLALTISDGRVDEDAVFEAVANSARFDVFRLSDAVTDGDAARAVTVLDGLRAEGVDPVRVCWALGREIGRLTRLKSAVQQGENIERALLRHGVWRRRMPAVKRALGRFDGRRLRALLAEAARADNTVKGRTPGDPWLAVTALVLAAVEPGSPARRVAR